MRRLGLDDGFGGIKIAEVVGGQVQAEVIPATVGIGQVQDLGMLSAGMGRKHTAEVKPLQVQIGSESYLVGQNVYQHVEPITRLDYQRLADGPEVRALIYSALATRMNGGPYYCSLLVGLPVQVMIDRSLAQKRLYSLRQWLCGVHSFSIDGQPYQVEIDKIRAMAQPLGSYWAWGLDTKGEWKRGDQDWDAPVGVVDIGFNTTDIFGIQSGRINRRFTGGDTLGMHTACRTIRDQIRDRFNVKKSLAEVDEMIKAHVAGQVVEVYHLQGVAVVNDLIESALSKSFSINNDFIQTKVKDEEFRSLIVTGGGTAALRKWLVEEYPLSTIPPDPVKENARGLGLFAQREDAF